MGTYSTGVLAIKKEEILKQVTLSNDLPAILCLLEYKLNNIDRDDILFWRINCVKWYGKLFNEVDNYIDTLDENNFGFVIINEFGESDFKGTPNNYGLYIEPCIRTPKGFCHV